MAKFLSRIFGSRNERLIKRMTKAVGGISDLESQMQALSDDQLQSKTQEFRATSSVDIDRGVMVRISGVAGNGLIVEPGG